MTGSRHRARSRRLRSLAGAILAIALTAVTGCSAPREEPGLFGRESGGSPSTQPAPSNAPATTSVPVVADGTWVSNDGRGVVVRYAVHAVQRMRQGTVLDWSITPLSAAGIGDRGALVPTDTDLGLVASDGTVNISLIDSDSRRVYRPLTRRGDPARCLCSATTAADLPLEIGQTRLLQIVFPPLPSKVHTIDVDIATITPLAHVPVTARNHLPALANPVALDREIEIHPALATTVTFDQGPGTQQFIAFVDDVIVADSFTALRWTIQSITDGAGLLDRPPISRAGFGGSDRGGSASGPALVLAGRTILARTSVPAVAADRTRCLCSDLRAILGEQHINERRTVVTTYPALPRGTETVTVQFPGLPAIPGIEVIAASDSSLQAGPDRITEPLDPSPPAARGWPTTDWPLAQPAEPSSDWLRTVDMLR